MKNRGQRDKYLVDAHVVPVGIRKLKQGIRLMQNSMRCWFTADVDIVSNQISDQWEHINYDERKGLKKQKILDYWSAFDNRTTFEVLSIIRVT